MKKILTIISSARGEASNSTRLAHEIVKKLQDQNPGSTGKEKDLAHHPVPHLEESHLNAFFAPDDKDTQQHREAIIHSNQAIAEILDADILVIAVPNYNFNIPSALKAWIDHVVRAQKTFSYKDGRPEGLINDKKVYLAIASGGVYTDGPMKSFDFVEPYLRFILSFIGLKDITTFRVEGASVPGLQETALQKGIESVTI